MGKVRVRQLRGESERNRGFKRKRKGREILRGMLKVQRKGVRGKGREREHLRGKSEESVKYLEGIMRGEVKARAYESE